MGAIDGMAPRAVLGGHACPGLRGFYHKRYDDLPDGERKKGRGLFYHRPGAKRPGTGYSGPTPTRHYGTPDLETRFGDVLEKDEKSYGRPAGVDFSNIVQKNEQTRLFRFHYEYDFNNRWSDNLAASAKQFVRPSHFPRTFKSCFQTGCSGRAIEATKT